MRKQVWIMVVMAALVCVAAVAQHTPDAHGGKKAMHSGADDHVAMMSKELNLTPDQQAQVKTIAQQTAQQANTLQQDTSLSKEQRAAKKKELHESAMTQIKAILTPEQQAKFDEMNAKMMKEHGKGHGDMMKGHGDMHGKPKTAAPAAPAPPSN